MFGNKDGDRDADWAPAPEPQVLVYAEVPTAEAPEPAAVVERSPRFSWWRIVIAGSAVVGALSLVVAASALRDTRDTQQQQMCLYVAQITSFQVSDGGDDETDAYQDAIRACGVDVAGEDE